MVSTNVRLPLTTLDPCINEPMMNRVCRLSHTEYLQYLWPSQCGSLAAQDTSLYLVVLYAEHTFSAKHVLNKHRKHPPSCVNMAAIKHSIQVLPI